MEDLEDSIWDQFKEPVEELSETMNCTHCKSDDLDIDKDGYLVCKECHYIVSSIIDSNSEWRYYGNDDSKSNDPTRCGMPISSLLPQSSHGSIISSFYQSDSYEMKKMRKYHSWNAMPYRERSLWAVFDVLTQKASSNGIPTCIIEDAKKTYKAISENRISRGSNRLGLIASCIWGACKEKNVPRSSKEIARIFNLPITTMSKGCKQYQEIMNSIKKDKKNSNVKQKNICLPACNPEDFIHRYCSNLNMNNDSLELALYVTQEAVKLSLVSENTPPSIAAGSIYLVSNVLDLNITKKDISKACETSEVTVSKCFKKLEKYYHLLIPQKLQNTLSK